MFETLSDKLRDVMKDLRGESRLTEENIDRQLILRVDGKEISRAWVHEPIRGETFNVTGAELDDPTVQRLRSGEADLTIEIAPQ